MDVERFPTVYAQWYPSLRNYLFRRTSCWETAEDLTQESFTKAWRAWTQYEDRGIPIQGWLYRIAKRTLIDYQRSPRNQPGIALPFLTDPPSPVEDEEAIVDRLDRAAQVRRLPAQQQRILGWVAQGYTEAEQAAVVGVSTTTIKARLHRARESLTDRPGPDRREYYQRNRDRVLAAQRAYRERHPERRADVLRAYRERKRGRNASCPE